jgi:hypothetical protein
MRFSRADWIVDSYRFADSALYKAVSSQHLDHPIFRFRLCSQLRHLKFSSSRPPMCICDRESRSPEYFAFVILHRERTNMVFGKRPHATARDLLVEPCCVDVIDTAA